MSVIAQLHFIFISTFIFSLPFDFNGFSGILEGSTLEISSRYVIPRDVWPSLILKSEA